MMKITNIFNKARFRNLLLSFCMLFVSSCHKDIQSETEVYRNDFESGDLTAIQGGSVVMYNGTKVVGFFNNGGFQVNLSNLANHELVKVSFDLYLHDSWAGNNTGDQDVVDGPDIWQMRVDDALFINTTFSNSGCFPTYCQQQSWPRNFPFHNDAGTGATQLKLPGRCHLKSVMGGTTMYSIVKYINHTSSNLTLDFRDILKQSNAPDPMCDESWSMDNLSVTITTLD
jgi:hypothetical protein